MSDRLNVDQSLGPGNSLTSPGGRVSLQFQADGNVVLYRNDLGQALWASNTVGENGDRLTMQGDGNLVLYQKGGNALWASKTQGNNCAALVQDDGNFVVYKEGGVPIWASNTHVDWDAVTTPLTTKDLGDGHYMQATASLHASSGVVSFTLTETCTNKIFGFTGGLKLVYFDNSGKSIGDSGTLQYGIGQAPLFSAGHRVVNWNGQAPAGTAALALMMFADPHNRFPLLEDIGNAVGAAIDDLGMVLQDIGSWTSTFCKNNPNVCVAVVCVVIAAGMIASGGTVVLGAGGFQVILAAA